MAQLAQDRGRRQRGQQQPVTQELSRWFQYIFFGNEQFSANIIRSWLCFRPDGCEDPIESLMISFETILFSPLELVVSNRYVQVFQNAETFRITSDLLPEALLVELMGLLLGHRGCFNESTTSVSGFCCLQDFRYNRGLNAELGRIQLMELFMCHLYNVTDPTKPGESLKLQKFVTVAIQRILNSVNGETRAILSPNISSRIRAGLESDEELTTERIGSLRQMFHYLTSPVSQNN